MKKLKLFLFFLILLFVSGLAGLSAQKNNKRITITGYVKDSFLSPVVNGWVLVDDRISNLFTDENGYYKVKTNSSAKKISILSSTSGILEQPIAGRTRINFTYENPVPFVTNYRELLERKEEINVGYGTVKKKLCNGYVSKINGADRKNYSYNSVYDMLKHVPGVRVNNNKICIQNPGSLKMDTEPLFVVDGKTVNSIDYIIPQWVTSIEILKGASAAIYGGRSTNGVILITLKR